jgi:hypothetical protein
VFTKIVRDPIVCAVTLTGNGTGKRCGKKKKAGAPKQTVWQAAWHGAIIAPSSSIRYIDCHE